MNNAFSKLHPFVSLIYFVFVIGFAMFMQNPICLLIAFLGSIFNAIYLNMQKAIRLIFLYALPLVLFVSAINTIFNHQGATMLMMLPDTNPLTLEALVYGVCSGVMFATVIIWFSMFNSVMTSDKLIFLFGRIIPSLSIIISMALRFVPRFSSELKQVRMAQKSISRDITDGKLIDRIRNSVRIVSVMISISMENAIDTSDSMKSRGYGIKKRTSFSMYKFKNSDFYFLFVIIVLGTTLCILFFGNAVSFRYYPNISGNVLSIKAIITYILYCVIVFLPLAINIKEDTKWKLLKSKI